MNAYKTTIDTFYDLLINDDHINTVTKSNSRNGLIDIEKKSDFPLAHINVINATPERATITFKVAVFALDLRKINKDIVRDKWNENDNENDNLDSMLYVLHRLWSKLRLLNDNIEVTTSEAFEPLTEYGNNVVDGWIGVFDVVFMETDSGAC